MTASRWLNLEGSVPQKRSTGRLEGSESLGASNGGDEESFVYGESSCDHFGQIVSYVQLGWFPLQLDKLGHRPLLAPEQRQSVRPEHRHRSRCCSHSFQARQIQDNRHHSRNRAGSSRSLR